MSSIRCDSCNQAVEFIPFFFQLLHQTFDRSLAETFGFATLKYIVETLFKLQLELDEDLKSLSVTWLETNE